MADKETPIMLVTKPVTAPAVKQTKRQLTVAFNRVLKKNKIVPLQMLIQEVLPLLEPQKQADVLLKLMEYQYPKVSAETKRPKIQVNTQVNNNAAAQSAAAEPKEIPSAARPALAASNIEEMLRIAAGATAVVEKKN